MKLQNKLAWMIFVSRRFSRVDRSGRSALTAFLASLGIAFGVMTLIVVMAVMNGFQSGYIESILEISSYHARAMPQTKQASQSFFELAQKDPLVRSITPLMEAQALVVGNNSRQEAALLRFVPDDVLQRDLGFAAQLRLVSGDFDLTDNQAVIGTTLSRALGVGIGDTINILALSGSSDVDLISEARLFTIAGLFSSDYAEINSTFVFFSLDTGVTLLGEDALPFYGIKLTNSEQDARFLSTMGAQFNDEGNLVIESWRTYNRSFFGALRVEKNLLMMLVFLIFIVVGVNIFNSMRRMVFERREEIAVLSALGSHPSKIQAIFIFQGLLIGLSGAVSGLLLGMLLSVRMDTVFVIISKSMYFVQYFFVKIFNPANLYYVTENPMFRFYAQIPARMNFNETALITLFGVLSALTAAWFASTKILKLSTAEVLRYE